MKARRKGSTRPEIPTHLLDPGNVIPSGPERLWPLLAALDEADPEHRWHDPIRLLAASGEVLTLSPTSRKDPDPA